MEDALKELLNMITQYNQEYAKTDITTDGVGVVRLAQKASVIISYVSTILYKIHNKEIQTKANKQMQYAQIIKNAEVASAAGKKQEADNNISYLELEKTEGSMNTLRAYLNNIREDLYEKLKLCKTALKYIFSDKDSQIKEEF